MRKIRAATIRWSGNTISWARTESWFVASCPILEDTASVANHTLVDSCVARAAIIGVLTVSPNRSSIGLRVLTASFELAIAITESHALVTRVDLLYQCLNISGSLYPKAAIFCVWVCTRSVSLFISRISFCSRLTFFSSLSCTYFTRVYSIVWLIL